MLKSLNIPTTDFITIHKEEYKKNADTIKQQIQEALDLPVFIKPARSGSSIGITKVKKERGPARRNKPRPILRSENNY